MGKITISKEELLSKYNDALDVILEECEWKSNFTGEEVCSIVIGILKGSNHDITISSPKLHNLYNEKVKSLGLSDEEWRNNYGIPEIIGMIHEILEETSDKFGS